MSKLLHVLNIRPGINSGIAVRAAFTAKSQLKSVFWKTEVKRQGVEYIGRAESGKRAESIGYSTMIKIFPGRLTLYLNPFAKKRYGAPAGEQVGMFRLLAAFASESCTSLNMTL